MRERKGVLLSYLDKDIGILIVDPVSAVLSTVKRVLTELGYKNVFQADSVLDGLNTMNANPISWVFTSLFEGQKLNGWHFLRLPIEFDSYRQVKTSFLLNSHEHDRIPALYSLGMVSSHIRPITYNSFRAEVERFTDRVKTMTSPVQAMAADLRDQLNASQSIDELERLELGLYRWIDSSAEQRMRLIQAQLKAGNHLEALLNMKQILASNPECAASVAELSKKYLGIEDVNDYKTRINVSAAVVVDPDEAQLRFVADALQEMGVGEVKTFTAAEAAVQYLKTADTVGLVISEWKLRDMEGKGFVQNIKLGAMRDKPFLIYSSLVNESDERLLEEIGGVFVLRKAMPKKAFKEAVTDIFARWRYPIEGEDIELKIYSSLQAGDVDYAQQLMIQFVSLPQVEKQRKLTLKGAFLYYEGDYLGAKAAIIEASKVKVPTHREIGWLGKILLKLGEFSDAQKCLDQANQMVPGNVERLCQMADVSAELGQDAATMDLVNQARDLGGDSQLVNSTFSRHAAALGQAGEAQKYMADEGVARGVVAHMNNLGVAYAASGKWKESIEAYVKALKALGKLHDDLQATVLYNLGLSLVRQNRYKEALPVLSQARSKGNLLLAKKVNQLQDKVKHAIESKKPLTLKEAPREIIATPKGDEPGSLHPIDEYAAALVQNGEDIKPGDLGLFRVYVSAQTVGMDLSSDFPRMIKNSA